MALCKAGLRPIATPNGQGLEDPARGLIKGGCASSQKDQRDSSGRAGIGPRNTFRVPLRGGSVVEELGTSF